MPICLHNLLLKPMMKTKNHRCLVGEEAKFSWITAFTTISILRSKQRIDIKSNFLEIKASNCDIFSSCWISIIIPNYFIYQAPVIHWRQAIFTHPAAIIPKFGRFVKVAYSSLLQLDQNQYHHTQKWNDGY